MKILIYTTILLVALSIGYTDDSESLFYKAVVKIAQSSIGLKSVPTIGEHRFTHDCIGFVQYVYYKAGLDLKKAYGNGINGVEALYNGLSQYQFVYESKVALPGDLIFFDNTYDKNKNQAWDDPLSHIGIVEKIEKHGTISYIHFSNEGVTRYKINLYYPNTYAFRQKNGKLLVINSYLRKNNSEGYPKNHYISSFFFRSFAHINVKNK